MGAQAEPRNVVVDLNHIPTPFPLDGEPITFLGDRPFTDFEQVSMRHVLSDSVRVDLAEVPFTRERDDELDEAVAQVNRWLDGSHQVIDHGTVGWFRVYSVVDVTDRDIAGKKLQGAFDNFRRDFLSKIHTVKEYNERGSLSDSPFMADTIAGSARQKAHGAIKFAVQTLTRMGARRKRDVLIARDLSQHRNSLTGGGVGGYAYRKTHAIEIDYGMLSRGAGAETIVHEWGHKLFFQLPQYLRNYVRRWYQEHVLQSKDLVRDGEVPKNHRDGAAVVAWEGFSRMWAKHRSVTPDEWMRLHKKHARTISIQNDAEALMDVVAQPGRTVFGKLKVSVRTDEGKAIRKGRRVRVTSSPGSKAYIETISGDTFLMAEVSRSKLAELVALDLKTTRKDVESEVGSWSPDFDTHSLRQEPGDYFDKENALYLCLEEGVRLAFEYLVESDFPYTSMAAVMETRAFSKFVDIYRDAARKQQERFKPRSLFLELFKKHANWKPPAQARGELKTVLASPAGKWMRRRAQRLGITPSDYAASNVDELWAETVAFAAMKPSKLPKPLKTMLHNVMQGKTERAEAGQRVRADNTPQQFRVPRAKVPKGLRECRVDLGWSPFGSERRSYHVEIPALQGAFPE